MDLIYVVYLIYVLSSIGAATIIIFSARKYRKVKANNKEIYARLDFLLAELNKTNADIRTLQGKGKGGAKRGKRG